MAVVRGLTTNDAGKARPADLGTGTPDAGKVLAGDGTWVAKGLAKPANPSAPAVPVIAPDGTVTTAPVSTLGGGANITGGGASPDTWVTATAYTAGRIVAVNGKTYFAKDSHTSGATFAGDLTAHWAVAGLAPDTPLAALTGIDAGDGTGSVVLVIGGKTFTIADGGTVTVTGGGTPPPPPSSLASFVNPKVIPGTANDLVTAIPDVVTSGAIPMVLMGDDDGTNSLSRLRSPGTSAEHVELRNLRMKQERSDLDPAAGYAVVFKVEDFGCTDTGQQWPVFTVGSSSAPGSILEVGIHSLMMACDSGGVASMFLRLRPDEATFDDHTVTSFGGLATPSAGTGIITGTAVITLVVSATGKLRIGGADKLTGLNLTGGSHATLCFGGDPFENGVVRGRVRIHGMKVLLAPTTQDILDAEAAFA